MVSPIENGTNSDSESAFGKKDVLIWLQCKILELLCFLASLQNFSERQKDHSVAALLTKIEEIQYSIISISSKRVFSERPDYFYKQDIQRCREKMITALKENDFGKAYASVDELTGMKNITRLIEHTQWLAMHEYLFRASIVQHEALHATTGEEMLGFLLSALCQYEQVLEKVTYASPSIVDEISSVVEVIRVVVKSHVEAINAGLE